MAQNITLLGASYADVPAVILPKTGGGTARFDDASVTTAAAADVASGKLFLAADGTITTGTASGGGGGSNWKLLASMEYDISTTSTSQTKVDDIQLDYADYNNKDVIVYVHIRDKAGKRNGYFYGSDSLFYPTNIINGTDGYNTDKAHRLFTVNSNGVYTQSSSTYGVYPYFLYYGSEHYLRIYRRYSSSSSGTINGTYKVDVYTLTMPSGMTLFT